MKKISVVIPTLQRDVETLKIMISGTTKIEQEKNFCMITLC